MDMKAVLAHTLIPANLVHAHISHGQISAGLLFQVFYFRLVFDLRVLLHTDKEC